MRAHTNISRKERNTLVLTDFKGADFSSSPLDVKSNRAIVMRNFINENGVNQKRFGWRESWKGLNHEGAINGIYEWCGHLFEQPPNVLRQSRSLLIHAGHRIYKYHFYDNTSNNLLPVVGNNILWEGAYDNTTFTYPADVRSQAFISNGKMYIIGIGTILCYDGSAITEITENAYIPTTTISINEDESQGTRASFEAVNMLTPHRKNTLLGTSEMGKTWTLDAKIDTLVSIEYTTKEGSYYVKYELLPTGINGSLKSMSRWVMNNGDYGQDESYVPVSEAGSYDNNSPEGHGRITLNVPTPPIIEGADNITVHFTHTVEGYIDRIKKCKFGCLFGANGNNDRLFLSGNIDYPNVEFYSAAGDFSYFPDQNTVTLGSSTPITGMVRLSDGAMAVLKKHNYQEATIYYATGEYDTAKTDSGQVVNMTAIFRHSAGGIGEGLVSSRACVNFLGDPLILSPNGVQGILLSQNVSTTERYTRERSRLIDAELKTKNLDSAQAVVYKNRCYIAVDDVCYVADARYKFVHEDDIDGSYNYEWWYWDNMPVRVWGVVGGKLCFGRADGKICFFYNGFQDKEDIEHDGAVSMANGGITHETNAFKEGDKITFGRTLHAVIETEAQANGTYLEILDRDWVVDGREVLVTAQGEVALEVGKKYTICNVDYGKMRHQLSYNGEVIEIGDGAVDLYIEVNEAIVARDDGSHAWLKLTNEGKEMYLARYNDEPITDITISARREQNVVAEWYTTMFDLGTNMYSKTLERISAATEGTTGGAIKIGYVTRQTEDMVNLRVKGVNSIDLNNFAFDDFVFDSTFANSYTRYVNVRNFNYIMFRFLSDNDKNCAVHNLTIQYKINNLNKGVK